MRTYLTQQKDNLGRVAFFLTTGGSGIAGTFAAMAELCGKDPVATLGLKERDVRKGDVSARLAEFVDALTS